MEFVKGLVGAFRSGKICCKIKGKISLAWIL